MLSYDDLRDEQLITLIANGEKDALEVFYNRYARRVFGLARYMLRDQSLAEEATQDIFLNLWLRAASYNPDRGTPKAWFMSIAHHRIVDVIKSRRRRLQSIDSTPHELLDIHPAAGDSTEEAAHRSIARDEILKALGQLPKEQRRVLVMAYFEGYSQSEDCGQVGRAAGNGEDQNQAGDSEAKSNHDAGRRWVGIGPQAIWTADT